MIRRILAVLVLVGLVGFGAWYVLRSTPDKEVTKLRGQIDVLLSITRDRAEWEAILDPQEKLDVANAGGKDLMALRASFARKRSDRILEIAPRSVYDLSKRAWIEDVDGKPAKGLEYLNRLADRRTLPVEIHLQKARIFLQLEMNSAAQAELRACADEAPVKANLDLGGIAMKMGQYVAAQTHYDRALDALSSGGREEEVEDRLKALLGAAASRAEGVEVEPDENRQVTLRRERDEALDDAIEIIKKQVPTRDEQTISKNLNLAQFYRLYDDKTKLLEGIGALESGIVKGSEWKFNKLLHALAGLRLAYLSKTPDAPDREAQMAKAEEEYKFVLQSPWANPAEGGGQAAGAIDPKEIDPKEIDPKESVDRLPPSLYIAREMLNAGEAWRLVEEERGGKKDTLGLKAVLEKLAGDARHRQAALLFQGAALLLLGQDQAEKGKEVLRKVVADAKEEDRAGWARVVAKGTMTVVPDSLIFLEFLDVAESEAAKRTAAAQAEADRVKDAAAADKAASAAVSEQVGRMTSLRLIQSAIERRRKSGASQEGMDLLVKARDDRIAIVKSKVKTPREFEVVSDLVNRYQGREAAIALLREWIERSPTPILRLRLAGYCRREAVMMEQAAHRGSDSVQPDGPWMPLYREALQQYLHLYKEFPFAREIQDAVVAIIARFNIKGAPDLGLAEMAGKVFQGLPPEKAQVLAGVIQARVTRDLKGISAKADALGSEAGPYGSLLRAAACIDEGEAIARETGDGSQFESLRRKALAILEEEVDRSKDYLPAEIALVQIELLGPKDDLAALEALEKRIEGLIVRLREAEGSSPSLVHAGYMAQARAIQKLFAIKYAALKLETAGKQSRDLLALIPRLRTALRRAIEASPQDPTPYEELSVTYLGISGPGGGAGRGYLLEPEWSKAVSALENAQETISVLGRLAGLYEDALRLPGEALVYHRKRLSKIPVLDEPLFTSAFQAMVGCLIKTADPSKNADPRRVDPDGLKKAREAIEGVEAKIAELRAKPGQEKVLANFEPVKHKLLGTIALSDPKEGPDTAIEHFRAAATWYRDRDLQAPVEIVNNLAWFLADRKKEMEFAASLIEGLWKADADARRIIQEKAGDAKAQEKARQAVLPEAARNAVDDTYGYVLYQKGDLAGAEKLYVELLERFRGREAPAGYLTRYAQVLFDLRKVTEAAQQMERINLEDRFPEKEQAMALRSKIFDARSRG